MSNLAKFWLPLPASGPDTHGAFRGRFRLARASDVALRLCGASWFAVWLDGEWLAEGPARFLPGRPEYEWRHLQLPAGEHLLAVHAHHVGADTRMLLDTAPFLAVSLCAEPAGTEIPLLWKGRRLDGYHAGVRRVNPQLGWIEWCDTRALPRGWRQPGFDDGGWPSVAA